MALANRVVSFPHAARMAGMEDVPEPRSTGSRAFCPFGEFSHSDSGREKAMRVYYDHAWCFAESLYLSPVRIFALMHDLAEPQAAEQLLDRAGYHAASWQQQWDELVSEVPVPDRSALAVALRTHLEVQYSDWGNRQYDQNVSAVLARCLGLLPRVYSEDDCRLWLSRSVVIMTSVLGG